MNRLNDKTIIFLGSSVTYGYAADGVSFVDILAREYGIRAIKEAVSGTTLVDTDRNSYISRMKTIPDCQPDAFICQLSTNDATQCKSLGAVRQSRSMDDFDTATIAGSMEYIIAYAKARWNCPVIFYTGTRYESSLYAQMVDLLYRLQRKWDIGIIDLWNDEAMNAVAPDDYRRYMADPVHPTLSGYCEWWTPKFEAYLERIFH